MSTRIINVMQPAACSTALRLVNARRTCAARLGSGEPIRAAAHLAETDKAVGAHGGRIAVARLYSAWRPAGRQRHGWAWKVLSGKVVGDPGTVEARAVPINRLICTALSLLPNNKQRAAQRPYPHGPFDALQAFARVVESGSFHQAAHTLHMSRTTVTVVVQQLEARLRVKLLHRTSAACSSRPMGLADYPRAARLPGWYLEDADASLSSAVAGARGRLRVDVPGPLASLGLIPALPAFSMRSTPTSSSTWA